MINVLTMMHQHALAHMKIIIKEANELKSTEKKKRKRKMKKAKKKKTE